MAHFTLQGLYTAIVTPFDSQGALDEQGLRRHLRFQIASGVEGIVALGITGEAPTLTHEEQKCVIQIGVEETKGQASLIVGTGSYSTNQTIENTLLAQQLGADAALIVTPYYNKPTQEGLYRHFKTIAESVHLPICIYNTQGRTGQNIQTETLLRLASIPNIIAVKESSGSIAQINEVIQMLSPRYPDFSILSGDDVLTLPLMALGGHGIISVASNLIPKPVKQLVDACARNDFPLARSLHYQLAPLFKAAFIETNPIPIKAAMQMRGMPAGPCRLPLCDLAPENLEKLRLAMQSLPQDWWV